MSQDKARFQERSLSCHTPCLAIDSPPSGFLVQSGVASCSSPPSPFLGFGVSVNILPLYQPSLSMSGLTLKTKGRSDLRRHKNHDNHTPKINCAPAQQIPAQQISKLKAAHTICQQEFPIMHGIFALAKTSSEDLPVIFYSCKRDGPTT